MNINVKNTEVGQYYVMSVHPKKGEAGIVRYWNSYTSALQDATEIWVKSPDSGAFYIVVEVQGKVCAQGVPNITTKLTEKLNDY